MRATIAKTAVPAIGDTPSVGFGAGVVGREMLAAAVDDVVPDGLRGRDALSTFIAEEHRSDPGLVITTTRELVILGDRGWLQWTAHSATGSQSSGTDFIEFAADGRIRVCKVDDA